MTLACIKEFLIQQSFQPIFFFIRKLHMHQVDLKPLTSPSTLLLQGEEVPFELSSLVSFLSIS